MTQSPPAPAGSFLRRAFLALGAVALLALTTVAVRGAWRLTDDAAAVQPDEARVAAVREAVEGVPASAHIPALSLPDSMLGQSRGLRFATLTSEEALRLPGFLAAFGELAIRTPAVRQVMLEDGTPFSLVVLRPFGQKRGEYLQGYRLGRWPAERWMMAENYYNPDGFVEVTPENASLPLSAHFTLGDFLTHDQKDVWPKYVVLEEKLIDKLELVLADLRAHGFTATRAVVLSGFRAPYYNDRGVGEGMARASRHQFGDAADILIDSDGDGRMDDLNGDGRVTLADVAPISEAVARVEKANASLTGGLGTYTAMGPRGPFAHVDVRGTSARWESGWWKK